MALPPLPGWLIDYATAKLVFDGASAAVQNAISTMCGSGILKYCACEEPSFKGNALVRVPFYDTQNCRCNLDADIAATARAFPHVLQGKKNHPSDHSAKLIVACAINHNYGIISSKGGMFLTPIELGTQYGITCLNMNQFVAAY